MAEGESPWRALKDYGAAVAVAVAIAVVIRVFLLEAYRVPTPVMRPTLEPGDLIFASKATFGIRLPGGMGRIAGGRDPERGEVVIYRPPDDPDQLYVKRVVALGGETVAASGGRISVNGKALDFKPTANQSCGSEGAYTVCLEPPLIEDFGPEEVPRGSVFVIGDLRSSAGGRPPWAIVPAGAVEAKALLVWMSLDPDPKGSEFGLIPRIRFERVLTAIR